MDEARERANIFLRTERSETGAGSCYTIRMTIPTRTLGRTGQTVSLLGLGGEGVLRTFGKDKDASALINRALDLGINYCESARAYSGSEAYYGKALGERRRQIFLASKSHNRDKKGRLPISCFMRP